jgi:hypothetical protein
LVFGTDDGTVRNTVVVEIVREELERKPYLGGFRNKRTETVFHNAW